MASVNLIGPGSMQWLLVLPTAMFLADSVYSSSTTRCLQSICSNATKTISCNKALILIVDAKDQELSRDQVALETLKRTCTSRSVCDPSTICHSKWLFVQYFCVEDHYIHRLSCNGTPSKIRGNFGYIQSPGYPNFTADSMSCKWQIDLSNNSYVSLSAHDLDTSRRSRTKCDGGVVVKGSKCDGGTYAPTRLCNDDQQRSLVRCGRVDVELMTSNSKVPFRFWLSYHVQSKVNPATTSLDCPGWLHSMEDSLISKGNSTVTTPPSVDQVDTQIFIVLLFIFCGISIVLLIILIIVCIRCRQIRLSVSDHVYSEPSPGLQAHYDYISSLYDEKPRPKLIDEYFEVADALPDDQRRNLPSSPAYAEVQQFAQLKKGQWSSLGSSEWSEVQNSSNPADAFDKGEYSDDATSRKSVASTPKSGGIMNKIVPERFAKSSKPRPGKDIQSDTGPKIYVVNPKTEKLRRAEQRKAANNKSNSDDTSMHDDPSPYEQIEVVSSKIKIGPRTPTDKRGTRLQVIPGSDESENDKLLGIGDTDEMTGTYSVVRETSNVPPSRVNQIKEGLLSRNNNGIAAVKDVKGGNVKSPTLQEKKSLQANKKRLAEALSSTKKAQEATKPASGQKKDSGKLSPAKSPFLKDGPRTHGIVKNGIQKFEHNTAL